MIRRLIDGKIKNAKIFKFRLGMFTALGGQQKKQDWCDNHFF